MRGALLTDRLPVRFLEPLKAGPFADKPLSEERVRQVEHMKAEIERLRTLTDHLRRELEAAKRTP